MSTALFHLWAQLSGNSEYHSREVKEVHFMRNFGKGKDLGLCIWRMVLEFQFVYVHYPVFVKHQPGEVT
jgi:hypothetical protein